MPEKNILIADDDQEILDLLKEILQDEDYKVFLASNGREAVEVVKNNPIDVAILDKNMPIMDGIETLERIKDIDKKIEVVIMTAYEDLESLRDATVVIGAFDYLPKPFQKSELTFTVRNALAKQELMVKKNLLKKELKDRILQLERDFEERTRLLRESQIKYKEIVNNSSVAIVLAQDDRLKFVNPKTLELTGYTQEEIMNIPFVELIHPEDRSMAMERCKKELQGEDVPSINLFRGLRKNRESFWVEINTTRTIWEGRPATLSFILDISDRKQMEEALLESEEHFRSLIENAQDIIIILNHDGTIRYGSPSVERVLGYKQEDYLGKNAFEFIHPDDVSHVVEIFTHGIQIPGYTIFIEFRVCHKNGSWLFIEGLGKNLLDNPAVAGVVINFRNITERKRAEEALQESEQQYRDLFENADDLFQGISPDGRFLYVNKKWKETLGYNEQELADFSIWEIVHPDSMQDCKEVFQKVLAGETVSNFETVLVSKNGQSIPVEGNANCRFERSTPVLIRCIFRDIRERKRAEEEKKKLEAQLQQSQRMEAIGTLAGGIAHNFNNLLMGIQGNASIMLLDIDSNHPHHKNLKNIEKLVQSGSKLTRQLLGYARKGRYEVKPISLNLLVRETYGTFSAARREIMVHQEIAENLYGIKADMGQIQQVLLNLYVNAADAMPEGGDLFLKTMNVTDKDMKDKSYDPKPGNYVLLIVRDTGVGMDKETMERIFDPFFTTKGLAEGTGLGMASVYGIIKAHGGYIDVHSDKGKGTTFEIYLPATEEAVKEEKDLSVDLVKGMETILLVDDEEMVLDADEQMLKKLGYEVLLATGGQEALELYEKNQDQIDMVLLDMVMPDMGGGKTYDRMKEINPNVKVLLSSGYSIDGEAKEILKRGCDAFIQKPFDIKNLSQKLREILDKE